MFSPTEINKPDNIMRALFSIILIIGLIGCNKDPEPVSPPAAPVASDAVDIGSNGFTAIWLSSEGAIDYELDIATDVNFTNMVRTVKNIEVKFYLADSLKGNTEYFYQVRAAIDSTIISENSNTISLVTLLEPPVALFQSNTTKTSFSANWTSIEGVAEYLLFVSVDSFPSSPPNNLPNYDGILVGDTTQSITGLAISSTYYYVVKAKVGSLISEESNTIRARTRD